MQLKFLAAVIIHVVSRYSIFETVSLSWI